MVNMRYKFLDLYCFKVHSFLLLDTFLVNCFINLTNTTQVNFISFILEPPSKVEFYNTTGVVIPCTVIGDPKPSVFWITALDQVKVNQVPGLRHIRSDGSLIFTPFKASEYRQDIHSNVYRCIASNNLGSIGSKDVYVNSVIKQNYDVQVSDEFSFRGNTAVLKCNIPKSAENYLSLTSWIRDELITISKTFSQETPYSVFSDGHLHIRNVTPADSSHVYRCITRNKLSGEISASNSVGRIIITEPQKNISPTLIHYTSKLKATLGKNIELGCASQGYPPPTYSWFKIEEDENKKSLNSILDDSLKYTQTDSSLVIKDVTLKDEASYLCFVNNTSGRIKAEIKLKVQVPLKVSILPKLIIAEPGRSAKFECNITGHPINKIIWTKNQKIIVSNSKYHFITPHVLQIWDIQKLDTGFFQCYVYRENESVQNVAQLKLAEEAPIIKESFVTQTVKLGEFVSLKCIATGNPLPQITWTLDDEPIVESNNQVAINDFVTSSNEVVSYVNVSKIKIEEGGLYACHANNNVEKVSKFGRVNVIHRPIVKQMKDLTAIEGNRLVIFCSYSGFPIQDIYWEHNNRKIPYNHRQELFKNGTLIINFVDKQNDIGDYKCIVKGSNEHGSNKAIGERKVKVQSPPVIDPFEFPPSLEEGSRSKIMCTVMKGDPPFVIKWFKNNKSLEHQSKNVVILDDYSVALVFSNVSLADRGNYTCVASNAVASANHTSVAIVHARPRWTIEPINTIGVKNKDVIIYCQADGFPEPVIEWKRAFGDLLSSPYKLIQTNEKYRILNNHSLEIKSLTKSDSGFYMCQASNGIGSGISTVIELQTRTPAHFKKEFRVETIQKGASLVIRCEAFGDKPLKIEWQKDGQAFNPKIDKRYKIFENILEEGMISEIRVEFADRRDSSLFACYSFNNYGNDKTNIQVIVQETPDPPSKTSIDKIETRSISLSWSPPYSGNSPIVHYIIQCKEADRDWNANRIQQKVPGTETHVTISNLWPGTRYHLRVMAENKLGLSDPGPVLQTITDLETPTEIPSDVRATPYGSNSIKVKWNPPKLFQPLSQIKGYLIGYKIANSNQPFTFKTFETKNQTGPFEMILTNLNHLTKYKLIVKIFNQKGSGPSSREIILKTRDIDLPEAPKLDLISTSHKTIAIKWHFVHIKAHILGFRLFIKVEGQPWSEINLDFSKKSYFFNDLLCGTKYEIYVLAYNEAGNGLSSNLIKTKTRGNAPKAPSVTSFIKVNQTSINLLLKEWENEGCPIKNFQIQYRIFGNPNWKHSIGPISGDVKEYLLQEINPELLYRVRVTAQSESGSTQAEYNFQNRASNTGWNTQSQNYSWISIIFFSTLATIVILGCVLIFVCSYKKFSTHQTPEQNGSIKTSMSLTDTMQMSQLLLKQSRDNLTENLSKECLYFSSNNDQSVNNLFLSQCSNNPSSTSIKKSNLDNSYEMVSDYNTYRVPFLLHKPKQSHSSDHYLNQMLDHTYSYPLKQESRNNETFVLCSDFKTNDNKQQYLSSWNRTLNR